MNIEVIAAVLFALALAHALAAKSLVRLARRHRGHAGLLELFGEVELVFGFWAAVLIAAIAIAQGGGAALAYAGSRSYTEPLFVFVIMVVAGSRPVLQAMRSALDAVAAALPLPLAVARTWLGLALVPLAGSLVTEPAAMTLAALLLAPLVFRREVPERLKYGAIGVLFVNVSIGGTLSSFAAPPVLMVARTWHWDSVHMVATFGWKAALAVLVNASAATLLLRRHLTPRSEAAQPQPTAPQPTAPVPVPVIAIHLAFLAAVVAFAHHALIFLGVFLLFIGYARATARHQSPLILKEALLVGVFLAGLVVLGGMQRWWVQPLLSGLAPAALYAGAIALTAVADNAALTYLGSLITGIADPAKYLLVAGAVAGGGLTVIANAPNPAGAALLRRGFRDEAIGAGPLLLGALLPTAVAALAFLL